MTSVEIIEILEFIRDKIKIYSFNIDESMTLKDISPFIKLLSSESGLITEENFDNVLKIFYEKGECNPQDHSEFPSSTIKCTRDGCFLHIFKSDPLIIDGEAFPELDGRGYGCGSFLNVQEWYNENKEMFLKLIELRKYLIKNKHEV